MGFRRYKNHNRGPNDNKRGRARPKLALAGAIVLAIGILIIFYVADVRNFDTASMIGAIFVPAGVLMLLLSMSKRNQIRFVRVIDSIRKAFRDNCQCCKCQNCGRNHNHWVHDDNDTRRRHY